MTLDGRILRALFDHERLKPTKAHDTHSVTHFRRDIATTNPATHSVFSRQISLCDGELDCADVAGSA